jgi:hypothetical protein
LPTPPLVFMTAIELRMARTGPSIRILGCEWMWRSNVADSRWRFQGLGNVPGLALGDV